MMKRVFIVFLLFSLASVGLVAENSKHADFELVFGDYARFDQAMVEKVLSEEHG